MVTENFEKNETLKRQIFKLGMLYCSSGPKPIWTRFKLQTDLHSTNSRTYFETIL